MGNRMRLIEYVMCTTHYGVYIIMRVRNLPLRITTGSSREFRVKCSCLRSVNAIKNYIYIYTRHTRLRILITRKTKSAWLLSCVCVCVWCKMNGVKGTDFTDFFFNEEKKLFKTCSPTFISQRLNNGFEHINSSKLCLHRTRAKRKNFSTRLTST